MEESATEGPSERMVGEAESYGLPYRFDDRIIETTGVLTVCAGIGLVLVVTPQEKVTGVHPMWIVLLHSGDDLPSAFHPSGQNLLGAVVETDRSVHPVPTALSTDVHVRFGSHVLDIVQHHTGTFDVPESHAEFEMDHHLLQRVHREVHQLLVLVILQPVDIDPHILWQDDLHLVDGIVLEESEIPLEVGEFTLHVGTELPFPCLFQQMCDRLLIDPVRGCIETGGFQCPLGTIQTPFTLLTCVRFGIAELLVQEESDASFRGPDVLRHRPPRRRSIPRPPSYFWAIALFRAGCSAPIRRCK